ncbi:MAG: alpha/beta superfamily hydrolase [Candidatus Azotimanducaceae bacterium]|jgi:alpha/beta superfamily hydrolase
MSNSFLPGPAGDLEYCLDEADPAIAGAMAVLCHPHPLYGGSMHDLALSIVQRALNDRQYGTLRFNFRGTGASQGQHDEGVGEIQDVVKASDWLCEQREVSDLVLAGYSFGAVMALQAQAKTRADRMILLAPPVSLGTELVPPSIDTLVIFGDNDTFVKAAYADEIFAAPNIRFEVLPGTDHFFGGAEPAIRDLIFEWLGEP